MSQRAGARADGRTDSPDSIRDADWGGLRSCMLHVASSLAHMITRRQARVSYAIDRLMLA